MIDNKPEQNENSLRDEFALRAMEVLAPTFKGSFKQYAINCYLLADAMMEQREGNDG